MDKREFLKKTNLCVILDCRLINYQDIEKVINSIIRGGAQMIQLRYKDIMTREYFKIADKMKKLCDEYYVTFIVNDDVAVAKVVDAHGVHLGQEDLPLTEARKILGEEKIIGISAHTEGEAYLAESHGADYLGVGSVFPTQTKENAEVRGMDFVKFIQDNVDIPVFGIGGINTANVINMRNYGIKKAAVSNAIVTSKEPDLTVKKFMEVLG